LLPVKISPEFLVAARLYKKTTGKSFLGFLNTIEKEMVRRGYIMREKPEKPLRKPRAKKILITEIPIQIYSDGTISWNGFDKFLWWILHRKPQEGFLPHADKIGSFH